MGRATRAGEPGVGALVIYALPGLGSGLPHFLILMYLMKYATDVLRISPAAFAAALGAARVWDAVSDVGSGYLSDRLVTRFGRRRPWLAVGGIALGASIVAVWAPPLSLDAAGLTTWIAIAMMLYFTAHTMVLVPYDGVAVELTDTSRARTRVFASRHVAYFVAMVGGLGAVTWLTGTDDPRAVGGTLGSILGGLTIASLVPLVLTLRESAAVARPRSIRALADVIRNPHALRLYVLVLVEHAGTSALSALGPFVTAYIIGDESTLPWVIGAYVLASLAAVPLVTRLAGRFGQRRVWSLSMLLTAAAFGALYFVHAGDVGLLMGCAAPVGIGDCCANVLGRSLLGDTIDFDQERTGERKEALYFSVWAFAQKVSYGVTVVLAGVALEAAGYRPGEGDSTEVEAVLRWAMSLIPASAYLVGFAISLGYRLDRRDLPDPARGAP